MLTTRARWLLAIAAGLAVLGLLASQDGIALSGLAIVSWLGLTWLGFSLRAAAADPILSNIRREIDGQVRLAQILTVGETHEVELSAVASANLSGLRIWIEDAAPAGCSLSGTSPGIVAEVTRRQKLAWQYTLRPQVVGKLALPGLQVKLTDACGLLQLRRFVPLRQELTVLPFLLRPQSTVPVLKPKNSQLLLGQHRHHNPGISGELLSIREYQPGDAPRTIAWKATARLGRLMTCEYESEVPIRATVICDLSPYQFAGRPGPAAADRVVSVTGSLARLLLSSRDPVASVIVNQTNRLRVRHAQGERQLTRILHALLARVGQQPLSGETVINELIEITCTACYQRFPQLFDSRVNPQAGLVRLTRGRTLRLRRRQLSLALAQLDAARLGFAQRLMEDDDEFRKTCLRFLNDHPGYRVPAVAVPDVDQHVHAHRQTVKTVCQAVIEGVARARDNELFVLVGLFPLDLAELGELENTLRVARAAHHRVIVLNTGEQAWDEQMSDATAKAVLTLSTRRAAFGMRAEVQRRLRRLGVSTADVESPTLSEKIASEVELLRFGRARLNTAGRG